MLLSFCCWLLALALTRERALQQVASCNTKLAVGTSRPHLEQTDNISGSMDADLVVIPFDAGSAVAVAVLLLGFILSVVWI